MRLRRLPPLAIAFALMAAALVATVLATRHTVNGAFGIVGHGQALTAEQAVRVDLAELDGPPTSAELATVLADHAGDGTRYIAVTDNHATIVAEAGTPRGAFMPHPRPSRSERPRGIKSLQVVPVGGGRLRVESPFTYRRGWGGPRIAWIAIEVDPSEGRELREASERTIWIGLLAALSLFGVAIVLVRREAAPPGRGARPRARAPARQPGRDVGGARARDQEPARVAQGQRPAAREHAARRREAPRRRPSASSTRRCGSSSSPTTCSRSCAPEQIDARRVDPGRSRARPRPSVPGDVTIEPGRSGSAGRGRSTASACARCWST